MKKRTPPNNEPQEMNLRKIYLIAILLLTLGIGTYAQESPKAMLVDEFGKLECEDVIARQDNLFADLQSNPNSIGYAIIFSDGENLKHARRMEAMFNGQSEFRRFDDNRSQIIRAVGSNGLKVQLWIVPAGASIPKFTARDWDFEIVPGRKPYRFNVSEYDEGPCPIGSQFKLYSDTLKANPHVRGHIVVWARTRSLFLKEKTRVDRDLVAKYSISRSQVKYFHIPQRSSSVKWEYWIVPQKTK